MGHRITEFDKQTPCHPTPLYEFLFAAIAYQFLKRKRNEYKNLVGKTFALTLILMGIERLLVEFLRVNALYAGLSMAQWISIALMIGGIYLFSQKPSKKV
jgi:prolipoprotein diacylglyceryltransferase